MMIRGGSSRAAFFRRADLPDDVALRDRLLIAAMGAGHPLQVDGIGGGHPLTSKVAIVGPSADPRADVDYLFLQVGVEEATVDAKANCGNILAGVGPFAIETGMIEPRHPTTTVRIRTVNSDTIAHATLLTPGGRLRYDGDHVVAGVNGSAAPIRLSFLDQAGAITGRLLPTGSPVDLIDGIAVSVVDFSIPVVMADARSFGLTGEESPSEIEAKTRMMADIEALRCAAGKLMGLGDVSKAVTPKVALLSPPRDGGTISSRYFTPWRAHKSHAVTGALCLAAATRIEGSVAQGIAKPVPGAPTIEIEHAAGTMNFDCEETGDGLVMSVVRSARLLFSGDLHIPEAATAPPNTERRQVALVTK